MKVDLQKWVEPELEARQIFREAWRYQRDYFYVDNFHGADWDQVYQDYLPLVEHVKHPADLAYLLDNIGAEMAVGHSYTRAGGLPDIGRAKTGLLGADIEWNNKAFRFKRIYRGESWFAADQLSAPLAAAGLKVKDGEYLLAINGKSLRKGDNLYQALRGTQGKQTRLTIATNSSGKNRRTVTVVPIASEYQLRSNAWVEDNRRYVDKQSKGKLAYVWVPNTTTQGFEYFNRYFFAQANREGIVIDERFNHGGQIAEYIIDILRRERNGYFNNNLRHKQPLSSPGAGIWGPKVMLINEVSGSGGDILPYMFRFYKLGPLVGKTTWGGLVGIWGVPRLMNGGSITAPRSGFYNLQGEWKIENEGVVPDIDVDQLAKYSVKGVDHQLEVAVKVALEALERAPVVTKEQPKAPIRVPQQ
nr:PDZ domain-containing protein [Pleionea sp. CnH1-48]